MAQATPARAIETIHRHPTSSPAGLSLAALGIVFGDIGTSPLYTFKTVLDLAGGKQSPEALLGMLSLILWTLVIVTTVKYVAIAMSLDNDGEGGILALMSLVGVKKHRPLIVAIGLFGAALIYGDGAVTPAISVLTALEGLNMATPSVQPYILPGTVVVLLILFVAQPFGTERIGRAFGPIMAFWFLVMAVLGVMGILRHPGVVAAVNPIYGIHFLLTGGWAGYFVLGGVFLCVTGAEALYADMGHFGPKPIRLSWLALVFPALVLNYAGQVAIVLDGANTDGNIFYRLCPPGLLLPMIVLATMATIIASQAIITGAYSTTRQALQLGWLPRMSVVQTSSEGYGQIYIGPINWLLMIATIGLVLIFRKSDNLASAYGIAVSLTMLMTTALLFMAMHEVWRWPIVTAGAVALALFVVDAAFVSANLVKLADGGYVPLLLAAATYGVMWIWHRGNLAVRAALAREDMPLESITAQDVDTRIERVPGTAVFLTRSDKDVPPVMIWHLKHNRSLHQEVVVLTIRTVPVPWTAESERVKCEEKAERFWRVEAVYGFMEHPDISQLVQSMAEQGCGFDVEDVTYYVGHITVMPGDADPSVPRWVEVIYAYLERNSNHVGDFLGLPEDRTVELGRKVFI